MKKELLSNILIKIVASIFFLLMTINSILVFTKTAVFPKYYQEILYYKNDNAIVNIILLIVFSIVILIFSKYLQKVINIKRLVLLVMIYMFILSLLFAILRRDYVQFDPFNVIAQAKNFIRDNYTGLDRGNNYLYIYSHQITTVFLFQIILSLFGMTTFILYIMQCFSISYIVFMLYKIADILFKNKEINYITVILSAVCFPLIFYVSFLYGILPGMFLALLSFYNIIKYLKEGFWYNLIIAIISINIAILFIGNNLINLLSIFSVLTIYLIKKIDKKLFLFIIYSIFFMLSFKSIIINYYQTVSQKDIPQGVNKITWVAMGMQEGDREAGFFNGFNYDIMTEENYDNSKIVEISKKSIKQRLAVFKNNPSYAYDFYSRKYESQFIDPTFQSLLITAPQKSIEDNSTFLLRVKNKIVEQIYFGNLSKILFYLMKVFQLFIYLFTLIFSIIIFKRRDELYLFIPISFIGGSIFHIIWEAKSRYIFPYFVFLIPLAACSFVYTKNYLKNIIFRKEKYYE
ncbi:hypothetical protein [Gemella sp. zg-1178]|uniref:hypothetical protein n=1 Tax=Gemella sp. zg-1178 TaxID=2840372 RepID=UPI001C03DF47|nr:hypothetical protein [Gemella sp. zg-1178]MBU0278023.1 hypothetical protein [Gemella sp. zg-1178]